MDNIKAFAPHYTDVFANETILRHLENYLRLRDLKILRLVCKIFSRIILQKSSFLFRTKLLLNSAALQSPSFLSLSFQPVNLELWPFALLRPTERQILIYDRISQVTCLIAKGCTSLTIWDQENPGLDSKKIIHLHSPHGVEEGLIQTHCPYTDDILLAARNLKSLFLPSQSVYYLSQRKLRHERFTLPEGLEEIVVRFQAKRAYSHIMFYYIKQLRRVSSGTPCDPKEICTCHPEYWSCFKKLLTIHQKTLTHVGIPCSKFWYESDETALLPKIPDKFPLMTSATFTFTVASGSFKNTVAILNLKDFLLAHLTQLQEMELECKDTEMHEIMVQYGRNLKKLKLLPGNVLLANFAVNEIKGLTRVPLEELILGPAKVTCGLDEELLDIFTYLPASLRSLQLNSIKAQESCAVFFKPAQLKKFTLLTSLEIVNGTEFTDDCIQLICSHLLSLQRLVIANCALSDRAFLGEFECIDDRLVATSTLAQLKDLLYLRLQNLGPNITARTVQFGIKFQRLAELDTDIVILSKWKNGFILSELLGNNPCLEIINQHDCKQILENHARAIGLKKRW